MMKYNKYKVLIIICWILLGLCCLIKLFGANIFLASTNNLTFIDFCNYIQNSFWYFIVGIVFNLITCCLYYMALLKENKPSLKSLKWFIPLLIYVVFKTIFYQQKILFLILDIMMMIGLPIIINRKIWYWSIISFILTLIFQVISMFLKLDNYKVFDDNVLVTLILSIDYIIMLMLFWLYRIRKEVK